MVQKIRMDFSLLHSSNSNIVKSYCSILYLQIYTLMNQAVLRYTEVFAQKGAKHVASIVSKIKSTLNLMNKAHNLLLPENDLQIRKTPYINLII